MVNEKNIKYPTQALYSVISVYGKGHPCRYENVSMFI